MSPPSAPAAELAAPPGIAAAEGLAGSPLEEATQQRLIEAFLRDGIVALPGLLAREAPALRADIEAQFAAAAAEGDAHADIVRFRVFERSRLARDLLALDPIATLVEAILGANCHMLSQNALLTPPGKAIDAWHVDETVFFPLPEGRERHPVPPPVMVLCVFVLLSEVPDLDHAPTQVVPGSCWSGRHPPQGVEAPAHAGRGPVSILGRPGDVYVQNTQCWHRGAPNRSRQARCLLGTMYGRRWMSQRLYPFVNYRLPETVEAGADERLLRMLGHHPRGTEGYA